MDYAKESLRLHEEWKGKIEVISTVKADSTEALSFPSSFSTTKLTSF